MLHSLNLTLLVDTGSQRTILKRSNLDGIQDYVRLETTDMHLTGLDKKSFKPIGYFQAEIVIRDAKF